MRPPPQPPPHPSPPPPPPSTPLAHHRDPAQGAAAGDAAGSVADVDVLLKSLLSQPGVEGALVYNDSSIPIKWTPGAFRSAAPTAGAAIPPAVVQLTAEMSDLVKASRRVAAKLLGAEEEVQMLRLRTRGSELIVTPSDACTLVVMQRARSQVEAGGEA